MRQMHVHVVDDGREWTSLNRLEREAVCHGDQTQVHHQSIKGGGGLRDDDERSFQPDVHGQTETLLGKVSNTRRRLFRRLSRGGAQSFFGRLEVVGKVLQEESNFIII